MGRAGLDGRAPGLREASPRTRTHRQRGPHVCAEIPRYMLSGLGGLPTPSSIGRGGGIARALTDESRCGVTSCSTVAGKVAIADVTRCAPRVRPAQVDRCWDRDAIPQRTNLAGRFLCWRQARSQDCRARLLVERHAGDEGGGGSESREPGDAPRSCGRPITRTPQLPSTTLRTTSPQTPEQVVRSAEVSQTSDRSQGVGPGGSVSGLPGNGSCTVSTDPRLLVCDRSA